MSLIVVKLGGSTAADTRLFAWITALTEGNVPFVVVPGGGSFADQVREAQGRIGFSDEAAHEMAILAMAQFGLMLCDLSPRFRPARERKEFWQVLEEGNIPVWLPSVMTIGRSDIAASWSVTSDSLSAWLAGTIGAEKLLLIKQTDQFSEEDDIAALQSRGVVDEAFGAMMPSSVRLFVAGPQHLAEAGSLMERGRLPGLNIAHGTRARSESA